MDCLLSCQLSVQFSLIHMELVTQEVFELPLQTIATSLNVCPAAQSLRSKERYLMNAFLFEMSVG